MILCDRSRALERRFRRRLVVRVRVPEPELNTEQHPRDGPSGSSRVAFPALRSWLCAHGFALIGLHSWLCMHGFAFEPFACERVAIKCVALQTRRTSDSSHFMHVTFEVLRASVISHIKLVALQSRRTQWGSRTNGSPCVYHGRTRRLIAGIARGVATSTRGVELSGLPSKASRLTRQARIKLT